MYLRYSRGSSLLELIVALSIFLPLAVGLSYTYVGLSKLLIKEIKEDKNVRSEYLLRGYARQVLFDLDSHRLPLYPRVHRRGQISRANGQELKLSAIHEPASDSNAITGFELDLERTMYVAQTTPIDVQLCPRYQKSIQSQQTEFLAISAERMIEVTLKILEPSRGTLCKNIVIIGSGGMITEAQDLKDPKHFFFVPIKRVYTLYRSIRSELRFLTHQGNRIVENQRISGSLKKMNLHLVETRLANTQVLEIIFSTKNMQKKQILLSHALARQSLKQFVYERP